MKLQPPSRAMQVATPNLAMALPNNNERTAFEHFVIKLFNQKSAGFVPATPDGNSAMTFGNLPAQTTYPDLRFLQSTRGRKYLLGVECKWRQSFIDGKIRWAEPDQVKNYIQFQAQWGITFFVAIGIGGEPSNPALLFITPLDIIGGKTDVSDEDLLDYKRIKRPEFMMHAKQLEMFKAKP